MSNASTLPNEFPTTTFTPYGQLPNPHPNMVGDPTNTPPPDLTGYPLPAFSDWRVAYIGMDGRLHAVSLDGRINVAGQGLPIQGMANTGVWTAGVSPDGKHLAYFNETSLTIADVTLGTQSTFHVGVGDSSITWSPDQSYVALHDLGYTYAVSVANGSTLIQPTSPKPTSPSPFHGPFGWLDATHVAVTPITSTSTTIIQSLDVTSGVLRTIASVPGDPKASQFSVTLDGRYSLCTQVGIFGSAPNPVADIINNTTGSVTRLPAIASALNAGDGVTQILWRPKSSQAIVATGFAQNGDLKYSLIDIMADTVTPLHLPGFPEAWSPDGSTLVVATGDHFSNVNGIGFANVGVVGSGPYTLSAMSVGAQGSLSAPTILTTQAMQIPALGFVRTS